MLSIRRLREIFEQTFWGRVVTWVVGGLLMVGLILLTLDGIERMAGAVREAPP